MEPMVQEAQASIGENLSITDALPQQVQFAIFIEDYINNPPHRDATAAYNVVYPFEGHPTIPLMQLYRQLCRTLSDIYTRLPH